MMHLYLENILINHVSVQFTGLMMVQMKHVKVFFLLIFKNAIIHVKPVLIVLTRVVSRVLHHYLDSN